MTTEEVERKPATILNAATTLVDNPPLTAPQAGWWASRVWLNMEEESKYAWGRNKAGPKAP